MGNKSHGLKQGWTFIAHKSYKIFSNANNYVVINYENDVVLQFTVTDADLEIITVNRDSTSKSSWDSRRLKSWIFPKSEPLKKY